MHHIKRKKKSELKDAILNKINNKKFLFYPAQFWAHKNHTYIVDAIVKINESVNEKIYCVFTGGDKGNLEYIKNLIKKKSLEEYIILFGYLSDDEISLPYQKCLAVIFPSYVGSHSFPLFEGFFYEKPVIYNKYIIDKDLSDKILKLDINNVDDLANILNFINNHNDKIKDLTILAKKFFNTNFNEKNISDKISQIIIEYRNYSKKKKF